MIDGGGVGLLASSVQRNKSGGGDANASCSQDNEHTNGRAYHSQLTELFFSQDTGTDDAGKEYEKLSQSRSCKRPDSTAHHPFGNVGGF